MSPKKAAPVAAGKVDQVAVMRAKGYMPAREVSKKTGNDIATVYRWADKGKVKQMRVGARRYIQVASLVNHLGVDVAQIFGIITEDQAKSYKSASSKSAAR